MNKNQWSLNTLTEKDLSRYIQTLKQQPHTEQDFIKLLAIKENYLKQKFVREPQDLLKVLNCKPKKRQEDTSNLCSCCLEFMGNNKYWCKICGNATCRKCLVRERELKDQSRAFFCQKCDKEYLQAMNGIQLFNKTEKLEKAFERLVQQQEGIQKLVTLQREKQLSNGTSFNNIASQGATAQRLGQQNKILKVRCAQLQKKVQFGRNISRDLKRKLKTLKQQHRQSFGAIDNQQEQRQVMVEPQSSQLNLSVDMNRESILTVTDRNQIGEFQDVQFKKKCKCDIY